MMLLRNLCLQVLLMITTTIAFLFGLTNQQYCLLAVYCSYHHSRDVNTIRILNYFYLLRRKNINRGGYVFGLYHQSLDKIT